MSRFSKPLVALALAIIPFFVFLGVSNVSTVNGAVVSDTRFNFGGLVMAVIGLGLVWDTIKLRARKDVPRKALAAVAGVCCLLQLASSVDAVRIDPMDWINPDRSLPVLEYAGPPSGTTFFVEPPTAERYLQIMLGEKIDIMVWAQIHAAYADRCHGGRHRVDMARAQAVPDYFPEEARAQITQSLERAKAMQPQACGAYETQNLMGTRVDDVNRSMDGFDELEVEYRKVAG